MQRFFDKIMSRLELTDHSDFHHFISSDMVMRAKKGKERVTNNNLLKSPTEVGPSNTGVLSFLRFNRPNTDRVFKSFKPSEILEGDDQDIFHKHQIYILLQESYYGFIAESLNQLIQTRENLGDSLVSMGDLIIETTQSKYRLGLGLKPELRDSQRNLDKKMQMFGLLMDELNFVFTRQGKEEIMKFGDVMLEYKNSLDPLKVVFNARTAKLMDYVDQLKFRNKKRERADKLKLRLGMNHPEVKEVIEEEKEATLLLESSKKDFDDCQEKVKEEIKQFEIQKSKDLRNSIKDYVHLSIRYEKTKLEYLEKALNDTILQTYQPPQIQEQAESIDQATEEDTTTDSDSLKKKKKTKKRQQQPNQNEFSKKPLQSSASLPTRHIEDKNRKKKNASYDVQNHSSSEEDQRKGMSTSYDERFSCSSSTWLTE